MISPLAFELHPLQPIKPRRVYDGPKEQPATSWPDSSTAAAIHRHRKGQGSSPTQASLATT